MNDPATSGSADPTHSPAADLPPCLLLVAGMHRSGTSALARVFNLLGAEIPGSVVPGFEGNALGHWEPQEIVDLHDAMLRSARVNVNGVFAVDPAWFEGEEAAGFTARLTAELAGTLAGGGLHVVKDPRAALFIPVWRRALGKLGIEPVVALPFRDPVEVALSLQRRQVRVYPDAVWPVERGVLLWLRYVLQAEAASRGLRRTFCAFDDLLDGWEPQVARMGAQLGLAWPRAPAEAAAEVDAFLSREHKHAERADVSDGASGLAEEVLALLRTGVGDPDGSASGFDAARLRLEEACRLFQAYVEELELRVGATPALRTEFVDFLRRPPSRPARPPADAPEIDAALVEPDPERRAALLAGARVRQRGLAAQVDELDLLNAALLGAARAAETSQAEQIAASAEAADRREEAAREAALSEAEKGVAVRLRKAFIETERARVELDRARAEVAAVREEAARLRGDVERVRAETSAVSADRARVQAQVDEVREREAALLGSTSWRVTAPLRALGRLKGSA